ncbi:MAG TPA: polysaccharide biosynthesis/export family protein [Vicinamibacteria bacterium]|nr:polysaccharide biosynthesis/export family protein [Vicinamibacteria bacterium]
MTQTLIAALLLLVLQAAPPSPAPAPAPQGAASSSAPADPDYRVGPGDVLEVTVVGLPELSRVATVQPDGTLNLPVAGAVPAAGKTTAQVRGELARLLAREYLRSDPLVEVVVREYKSQFVTVLGEVTTPGRRTLRGATRLIDVLIESGGFTRGASGEIVIARVDGTFPEGARTRNIRISSAGMSALDQQNLEMAMRHGDVVTALSKPFVTVLGEVVRPGKYAMEAEATVSQAVATAGGLTRFGSTKVRLRRVDAATGRSETITVDLKDVRAGKDPDPRVANNDEITVSRRLF